MIKALQKSQKVKQEFFFFPHANQMFFWHVVHVARCHLLHTPVHVARCRLLHTPSRFLLRERSVFGEILEEDFYRAGAAL